MMIFILGAAGSGKTTLTASFGKYLEDSGYSVGYVNLDTGVMNLPYEPNIDVREFVTAWELMEEGFGPNGAIVESYDRLLPMTAELSLKAMELEDKMDYVLVDTPGQIESFLFHPFGLRFVEPLVEPLAVYLIPPEILKEPHDFCFARFFALMIDLRLGTTTVPALSKVDTVDSVEEYAKFLDDLEYLSSRLKFEPSTQGLLAYRMCSVLPELTSPTRVIYLSARTREGFEELETLAHEHYCNCGDLT
jgi:GTPase SAR1 family protein